jgi:chromosome segregation ATPase
MKEELKKDVEAAVSEIFSQKEEAEQKARTEEALQKSANTISELTEALETRNQETEETASEIASLTTKTEELTTALEAAQKEATEVAEKLAESENTIEEMNKDKAAELRMSELEKAGVALSNSEAQTVKVREMDEESFASYKDELVAVREAVKAELANSEVAEEEVAEEEVAEEEVAEEDADETIPAEIDKNKAVAGALNLEIMPSDDVLAKYRKLGEAMASRMKNE